MIGAGDAQVGCNTIFCERKPIGSRSSKRTCLLFSPEDSAAHYKGSVDPNALDLEKLPLSQNATACGCALGPGERLCIIYWW
jgi:hypothetical protein